MSVNELLLTSHRGAGAGDKVPLAVGGLPVEVLVSLVMQADPVAGVVHRQHLAKISSIKRRQEMAGTKEALVQDGHLCNRQPKFLQLTKPLLGTRQTSPLAGEAGFRLQAGKRQ